MYIIPCDFDSKIIKQIWHVLKLHNLWLLHSNAHCICFIIGKSLAYGTQLALEISSRQMTSNFWLGTFCSIAIYKILYTNKNFKIEKLLKFIKFLMWYGVISGMDSWQNINKINYWIGHTYCDFVFNSVRCWLINKPVLTNNSIIKRLNNMTSQPPWRNFPPPTGATIPHAAFQPHSHSLSLSSFLRGKCPSFLVKALFIWISCSIIEHVEQHGE